MGNTPNEVFTRALNAIAKTLKEQGFQADADRGC
jgi:hypothetical protein